MHRLLGRMHAGLIGLRSSRGQGTVEYVALILLVALVMAGRDRCDEGLQDR